MSFSPETGVADGSRQSTFPPGHPLQTVYNQLPAASGLTGQARVSSHCEHTSVSLSFSTHLLSHLWLSKLGDRNVQPDNSPSSPPFISFSFGQSLPLHCYTVSKVYVKSLKKYQVHSFKNANSQHMGTWSLDT